MARLSLDSDLGREFTAEPVTGSHVGDVFDIVSAEVVAVLGRCPYTAEDVRSWITPPEGGQSAQLLVRDREDGAPVQWWSAFRDPGGETVYAFVRSHPRLSDGVGDRLGAAGWVALLAWIRAEVSSEGAGTPVHSGTTHGNDAAKRQLRAAGFTHARTIWAMSGAVGDAPRSAAGNVEAHTIVASQDAATMHRILDEAFADHWGYETLGFDDWWSVEKSQAGHDPALWRFAVLDGEPVSAMIMSRRVTDRGALYVQELATLAPYRRRGIAGSLLGHAFDVAAEEGLDKVELHVDSENTYEAPSVYRRAGMEVQSAFDAFTQTLAS